MSLIIRTAARVGLLSYVVLLSACPGPVGLIQLDNEWARTYAARLEAERANPDFLLSLTDSASFDAQLADLSARAEKQGDAALAKDPATAAGLYRVAVAAAWKSGTVRETQVVPISDKGIRACESLPNKDASQPRDCAFIRLVPQLAALDVKGREVRALMVLAPPVPPEKLAAELDVAGKISGLMAEVLALLAAAPSPSASFSGYVKLNLAAEFCTLQGLSGRFFSSGPSTEQQERMRTFVRGAESKLQDAGISTTCN